MVQHINRKNFNWVCKCGKESGIHTTEYPAKDICEHLYFCNDCWWVYQGQPRKLSQWELEQKQLDIAEWRKRVGYEY